MIQEIAKTLKEERGKGLDYSDENRKTRLIPVEIMHAEDIDEHNTSVRDGIVLMTVPKEAIKHINMKDKNFSYYLVQSGI